MVKKIVSFNILVVLAMVLDIVLCSYTDESVRNTLNKAGANKLELEKVLAHYQNDELKHGSLLLDKQYGCPLFFSQ